MAEETTIPYQVAFVYACQCCKKSHTEFGQIRQPGVAITHREELKRQLLELIKEKFSDAHPGEKFDIDNLAVEEVVDGNKIKVDPQTIKPREVKGEDLTKPKPKKEEEKEKAPEAGFGRLSTDVASIGKMLVTRMAEIRKREKEIDEQIEQLTKELKVSKKELTDLEKLEKATKEIIGKKPEKEKDKK